MWFIFILTQSMYNTTFKHGWPCSGVIDFHIEKIFITIWLWTMVDFHIGKFLVTIWRWMMVHHGWLWLTMVDHDWFSYWDSFCHNVMLDPSWPWLIFILRQYLSQCDVEPWLTMYDHGYWPLMAMIDHGSPWLKMVDFHIESIFFIMWHYTLVYHYYKPKGLIL